MVRILETVGVIVVSAFLVLAFISAILPRINEMYNPLYGTDPEVIGYSRPGEGHILGTDFMGRDLFSQLCSGAAVALLHGAAHALVGVVILLVAAYIMAQVRKETPQLEDTMTTRYVRFVAFPFCVIGLLSLLSILLASVLGRLSIMNILFFGGCAFGFLGWLAVGHDLEMGFRKGEKIQLRLLLSYAFLVISYFTIFYAVMTFYGLGDPSVVTWGMMIQWCFTSGYTFRALHWLLPPIICTYIFSRGALALSYGVYSRVSEKYSI